MPLNVLRLNQRHQHPTPHIVFIKALPGPSKSHAEHLLSRVAAICHPILSSQHISVTALEEHEWNREFIGRNFNAGEVIQLVLRSRSGAWLSFRSIVMVAMHELAHCKQMNHSRAFWAVRNEYALQMRELWTRGYTGEGVWGRGRELDGGAFESGEGLPAGEEMPERLCGGAFRSRRGGRRKQKKRRIKQEVEGEGMSHAERKKRRVERKFGVNGERLGGDETVKFFLDGKKVVASKPTRAGSQRGRELRAQAALVRLGALKAGLAGEQKQKEEEEDQKIKGETSGTGEEFESEDDHDDTGKADALDINGEKLRDSKGGAMIKVEDEDEDEGGSSAKVRIKQEMDELNELWAVPETKAIVKQDRDETAPGHAIQGRPGGSFYRQSRAGLESRLESGAGSARNKKRAPEGSMSEGMRSQLDAFHNSGSILTAFKKQDLRQGKKGRPKAKAEK